MLLCLAVLSTASVASDKSELEITNLKHYADPLYGFDAAIPASWQRIVIDEVVADSGEGAAMSLDTGYAVGFESLRTGEDDRYADYLMIEVLPGRGSGAFESTGKERESITIDGRPATRDRVWLDAVDMDEGSLALVVYQASLTGLGYQIDLYAIGEQHESKPLGQAFDALLETFRLREEPYTAF